LKVLFVCHRVPYPPKRGGKIRPFNIIKHLTEQGHSVTVASLARSSLERDEASGLAEHCDRMLVETISDWIAWPRMLASAPSSQPSSFAYFYSRRLARRLAAELREQQFDLVFVHCSSVAPYVQRVRGPLRILDYGDVDSQKWREYALHRRQPLATAFRLEAIKLERTERLLSANVDLCTCTTAAELSSLRQLGVATSAAWFPNGVDADFFAPDATEYDPTLIAFVGRMDYFPNQQAVLRFTSTILPRLRERCPKVRVQIVGAEPPAAIRRLGRLPDVSVTGSVPDVRPYVRRAALTVAPLEIARGTQNKLLESMAMGVPVVCSPQAAGGVDAVPGEHLRVASTVDQYVDAIASLLGSREARMQLAIAARDRVLTHHSWPASMRRLDGLIAGAFAARGAQT
jgi:sugar transferase (PEP-CTERM/EpsH1 system associated)